MIGVLHWGSVSTKDFPIASDGVSRTITCAGGFMTLDSFLLSCELPSWKDSCLDCEPKLGEKTSGFFRIEDPAESHLNLEISLCSENLDFSDRNPRGVRPQGH